MPFDDPQEQDDEVSTLPYRLRPLYPDSAQTALAHDDQTSDLSAGPPLSSQQLPVSDAQFQRRFGALSQVAAKPSIGQRILALGQRGASPGLNEIETSALPGSIGDRIVKMAGQPADSLLPRLTTKSGTPIQVSAFDQIPPPRGLFSNFVPVGSDTSVNPRTGSVSSYSPTLIAQAQGGQRGRNPAPSQPQPPPADAGSISRTSTVMQQPQNQNRRIETTPHEQENEGFPLDEHSTPKVKPPQDLPSGDWSGGEVTPGQPIVNSGYHTDYPGRGKRKIGGDPAWRNNNPGNIRYSTTSPATRNAIGYDYQNFAIFDTMQDGIRAQDTLWRTPRYQNMTLQQAVRSWTSGDPPSTQESYLRDLMTQTSAQRDTKVSALNESQLQRLEEAQRKREGGRKGRVVDIPKPKPTGKGK